MSDVICTVCGALTPVELDTKPRVDKGALAKLTFRSRGSIRADSVGILSYPLVIDFAPTTTTELVSSISSANRPVPVGQLPDLSYNYRIGIENVGLITRPDAGAPTYDATLYYVSPDRNAYYPLLAFNEAVRSYNTRIHAVVDEMMSGISPSTYGSIALRFDSFALGGAAVVNMRVRMNISLLIEAVD